jgi:DNA (cytosine-5)-methyltransferase 1
MGSDYGLGLGLLVNYLSVCSGIEAATVAWHDMGWNPIGFSEIEKFPSQLLQHHYPHVTNYGDMTKFKEWNINDTIGLLVGGTPCQSFSVAGLRKGLEDPRGNLMLTYLGIANHFKPKWLLWENVPGVLSSNGGEDFACLLKGMAELGYGFAYRVLDAQHFRVPQRRRRVFVVGCIGDWRSAAKVLFEPESLCRDITPSREKGKDIANCLRASPSSYGSFNPARSEGNGVVWPAQIASTLNASFGNKQGLENQHINSGAPLFVPHAYNITFCDTNGTRKDRPNGGLYVNETDTSNTLTSAGVGTNAVQNMRVRRLTPMECERLQGFPDNYTNTPTSSDTHRYKALGNSMAVPVMKWIGQRINEL